MSEKNEETMVAKCSNATIEAIDILVERDGISLTKYKGQTMDRIDLTPEEWANHWLEEMADGLKYAVRTKKAVSMLASAREILCTSGNQKAQKWVTDFDNHYKA